MSLPPASPNTEQPTQTPCLEGTVEWPYFRLCSEAQAFLSFLKPVLNDSLKLSLGFVFVNRVSFTIELTFLMAAVWV